MEDHNTLTHLATILAAAFVGGAVFNKLKQPVLVGYIIVGIVLGPSFLGVVEGRDDISILAELGILLLLFLAGMELDLKNFKAVSKISVITCAAQIFVGLVTMAALGFFSDWPINLIILMGFAIALSSTAVALKILEDNKLRGTKIGNTSLGILIAQDLAVIPMILIVGSLNTGEGFNIYGLAKVGIAVLLMVGLMVLLTTKPKIFGKLWFKFEKFYNDTMVGQPAITGLAFCFSLAAIAGAFGLSAAYGAFLAGIVIGATMNRKTLEEHTKPIFDVMIMVFFLSIGLLIDLQFLAEHWIEASALLFITMLIKTVVNYFVLRWQGMERNEAYVTGAVLAQVGEFSFILAAMGLAAGTIEDVGYKYVVAVISLSLLATPVWLYLVKKFEMMPKVSILRRQKKQTAEDVKLK